MATRETVKILLIKRNMTIKTLAQELEKASGKKYSRESLSKKLTRDTLRYGEMEIIAKILGYGIEFKDLKEI